MPVPSLDVLRLVRAREEHHSERKKARESHGAIRHNTEEFQMHWEEELGEAYVALVPYMHRKEPHNVVCIVSNMPTMARGFVTVGFER